MERHVEKYDEGEFIIKKEVITKITKYRKKKKPPAEETIPSETTDAPSLGSLDTAGAEEVSVSAEEVAAILDNDLEALRLAGQKAELGEEDSGMTSTPPVVESISGYGSTDPNTEYERAKTESQRVMESENGSDIPADVTPTEQFISPASSDNVDVVETIRKSAGIIPAPSCQPGEYKKRDHYCAKKVKKVTKVYRRPAAHPDEEEEEVKKVKKVTKEYRPDYQKKKKVYGLEEERAQRERRLVDLRQSLPPPTVTEPSVSSDGSSGSSSEDDEEREGKKKYEPDYKKKPKKYY